MSKDTPDIVATDAAVKAALHIADLCMAQDTSMSAQFLNLMKQTIKDANNVYANARTMFKGACASAEEHARNVWQAANGGDSVKKTDIPPLTQLLPSWSVYKSNVLTVMSDQKSGATNMKTMTEVYKKAADLRGASASQEGKATFKLTEVPESVKAALTTFLDAFAKLSKPGKEQVAEQWLLPLASAIEYASTKEGASKPLATLVFDTSPPIATPADRKEALKRGGRKVA